MVSYYKNLNKEKLMEEIIFKYKYHRSAKEGDNNYKTLKRIGKAVHYIYSISNEKRLYKDIEILKELRKTTEESLDKLYYFPKDYTNARLAIILGEGIIKSIDKKTKRTY
jgi:hypothetical protein